MLTLYEQKKREDVKNRKPKVYNKIMRYEERYNHGESVAVIQLQYNYMCNMRCEHCAISTFQTKSVRKMLTPPDVKVLCDQADEYGLAQLDLTGGEPIMFPDLEDVLLAIDTSRFFVMIDTNGWLMTQEKINWLKDLGIDRIQVSLDSLNPKDHDNRRRMPGSFDRVINTIDYVLNTDLQLKISTTIDPGRVYTDEFKNFLKFAKSKNASINAIWSKPVGMFENRSDLIIDRDAVKYINNIAEEYEIGSHVRESIFGLNMGCIACKKIISINAFGDIMPCIWMYLKLGNLFETPLRQILEKGMRLFSKKYPLCRMSEDKNFIKRYQEKTKDKELPIPIEEFGEI